MSGIRNLVVITSMYPTEKRPKNTFVESLVHAIADKGITCSVICPVPFLRNSENLPHLRTKTTAGGNEIKIYAPRFLSLSTKKCFGVNTSGITLFNFMRAVERVLKNIPRPDALYGHFIFASGITAASLGKKYAIPSFLAYGENTDYTVAYLGKAKTAKRLEPLCGIVSVSGANTQRLLELGIAPPEKIALFPNGADTGVFAPQDRKKARAELNLPQDKFIAAFVGHFKRVKGADRVCRAIDSLGDPDIKALFAGLDGESPPFGDSVLFSGSLAHEKIPRFLNAADVFVLPTLSEGCCNAICEAMACGLPIISSDLPFNDGLLDEKNSFRIDPLDISEIADAIKTLKNNSDLREKMGAASRERALENDIRRRARGIVKFLNERIEANQK